MATCETCKANKVCDHNKYGFENCNNYISADVVEVVRCEDCQFAYIDGDRVYCRNTETPWYNDYFEVFTETTDFCSYGTPKERGGEK